MSALPEPDWADLYRGTSRQDWANAREAFDTAIAVAPGWLTAMMRIRHGVARLLGARAEFSPGLTALAALPVLQETPAALVVGGRDGGLTHHLETRLDGNDVIVCNRIWFHHWTARAYLRLILPGHNLALRHMMGRIAQDIQKQTGAPARAF